MSGVYRHTIDRLPKVIDRALSQKIPMVALFPYTKSKLKNKNGSEALNEDNLVCRAIRFIKKRYKNKIGIMCDVALDPYTSHGHDGLLKSNYVLNDETVEVLTKQSLLQAQMGCDVIAPSDMMDGRVGKIRKYLELGGGVSACAVCDGFFYKGQDVAIVGAGDSACEEAHYLSKLCNKVTMLVRRDEFRASKIMQERVERTDNIEILYNTETIEVLGNGSVVESVAVLNNKTKEEKNIPITGFFVAIGHMPNTEIFKPYIEMDETGYIINEPGTSKTNIPGVFVSGDAADHVYRQAVTAAGTGCMAALDAEKYLASK